MDLFEFEEAVKNSEITDVEPYMRKQKFDMHRSVLARHGIEVDRIIKRDGIQVIIELIERGLETERYEGWKNHPSVNVREALAEQGYYHDCYINDKSPRVRNAVINKDNRQGLKRMHNPSDRFSIRRQLIYQTCPDIEVLTAYLDTVTQSELKNYEARNEIELLKLKQKSLQMTPTTIEKTMTPYQLFEVDNPLWMSEYTAEEIDNIIYSYEHIGEEYQQKPDCVKLIFDVHKQLMYPYAVHIVERVRQQLDERKE
jgi:hypothetical protein